MRWNVEAAGRAEHQGSVEDLQWSPTEATVFISCGVDRSIKVSWLVLTLFLSVIKYRHYSTIYGGSPKHTMPLEVAIFFAYLHHEKRCGTCESRDGAWCRKRPLTIRT